MQNTLGRGYCHYATGLVPFCDTTSEREVLLALTINKHYFIRGVVRYAREHDWYLVTDMMYTGRVPLGWRGDGILTTLGYRKELADFIK